MSRIARATVHIVPHEVRSVRAHGIGEVSGAVETVILPGLDAFRPELVLVSAGFDAHARDPLANLNLVESDFAWITTKLLEIADRHASGRLVSMLEGGYDLQALGASVAAHVETLMAA